MKKLFLLSITAISIGLLAGCGSQASGGEGARAQSPVSAQSVQNSQAADQNSGQNTAAPSSGISEEQAKSIALEDAGLSKSDVSYLRVHLDRDDGHVYYEVDFAGQGTEYDYEIQVSDGAVLKAERDRDDDHHSYVNTGSGTASSGSSSAGNQTQTGPAVSFEEAEKLALDRVPGASGEHLDMELEHDDGILLYEGEIHCNGREYEFEISADTGDFIRWHEDHDD